MIDFGTTLTTLKCDARAEYENKRILENEIANRIMTSVFGDLLKGDREYSISYGCLKSGWEKIAVSEIKNAQYKITVVDLPYKTERVLEIAKCLVEHGDLLEGELSADDLAELEANYKSTFAKEDAYHDYLVSITDMVKVGNVVEIPQTHSHKQDGYYLIEKVNGKSFAVKRVYWHDEEKVCKTTKPKDGWEYRYPPFEKITKDDFISKIEYMMDKRIYSSIDELTDFVKRRVN